MRYDQILERIRSVTHARTQAELAAILDIKQSSISDSKKRQSIPADWYMKLFEKAGVNPDWLKNGTGPIYLRTEAGYIASNGDSITINPDLLTDPASCSKIATVYSLYSDYTNEELSSIKLKSTGKLSIPKIYIKNGIFVLHVDNNAASPTVKKGAYVGVDTFSKYPVSGEWFAIYIPYEGIIFRKIFWIQENNYFVLRTENKEFPEYYMSNERKDQIFGRLSWVMQSL